KLAVVPAAAAVGMFALGRGLERRRYGASGVLAGLALAFAVGVAPWWTRNIARYGNPLYPQAIPIVGHGVTVGDFQKKDQHFVPSRAAWPLYPLVEPIGDQSGAGPLFVAAVLPAVAAAAMLWRRRRGAVVLIGAMAGFTLPAWWLLTQHEPRHLLALFGIGFACLPASLLLTPRRARPAAAGMLGAAAIFSALLTLDQGLAARLREPRDRATYYDVIWGVDPRVANRPES